MNNFTRGMIIGSVVGTTLGMIGVNNNPWMRKNVLKPSKRAIKKAGKVMSDVAGMM